MYLNGEFLERDSIIRALRAMKDHGVAAGDLDVFSDEPLELPGSALLRQSHMSLAVVTGAICFGLLVVGFVYFTQFNYPLITGGMPIFSVWATGVVFYELTMLGAILTSLVWFLYESGLLNRKRRQPAPSFEPGTICLRIRCGRDQESALRRLLETAGATNLRSEDASH
jgi:hypothetical protein